MGREFRGFLYGRAWTHAEGPVALFNHAVTWLRKNRVLLPGVSVLARQSEARTAAERRLYEAVARAAHRADPALAPALAELLVVPEGRRVSELERLRTPPTKSTGTAMVRAMERVEEITARRASDRERLAMLPQLEKAARIPAKASKILTEELDLVTEHDADLDVAALRAAVEGAVDEDVARLSPLKDRHINWAATSSTSRRVAPARACGPSGTRTPSRTTRTKPENLMWMHCA